MNQKYFNRHLLIVLFFIFISFSGCAKDKTDSQAIENEGTTKPQLQNKPSGTDLSKIKICELVPDELVAKTLGAKTVEPAQTNDLGPSHGCTYTIDPAGPDNLEVCTVWLNPPETFTSPEDELETAHALNQEATVENLTGFGDEAFVVHNKTEEQSIIFVLLRDKLCLQVAVEHFDDAKKLTELILSRLKGI